MVQQMIEKFEEYKFLNSQTAMPVGAKQSPVSAKKIALRDLPSETNNFAPKPSEGSPNKDKDLDPPNETNNIASKPLEESPHKDNGSITGFAGFSGSKRKQLSSPSTLSPTQQPGYSVYNGHLVYVRRKLEAESSKVCADNVDCSESVNDGFTEMKFPRDEHEKKSMASGDEICMCSPKNCIDSPKKLSISPIEGEEYWKERFVRLQMFLKNCDQSNQEEYVQRLRSLSASGRNMHAVELEKRAIQLLLEEGITSYNDSNLSLYQSPFDSHRLCCSRDQSNARSSQENSLVVAKNYCCTGFTVCSYGAVKVDFDPFPRVELSGIGGGYQNNTI
ncbi:hypothetical protein AXF42_Ash006010 [Apostasia shenzhenica]|uniref:Uncharacterized protein n=1 Tax=Apostasia shenzhenica TaxID=1088818 RepID=A0A2I0AZZ7_9ASPA|nr:hypothetical protein AXF42_Ash006010 [Apostasia shenzhenica]